MVRTTSLPICTLLCLAAFCSAQVAHVVDGSGQTGKFTTINAALAVAKDGDSIYVKKGTYTENLDLVGKAVNILGIAPKVSDVRISAPVLSSKRYVLRIERHPAGKTTRIARVTTTGLLHRNAIVLTNSKGKLVFDQIQSDKAWSLRSHQGTIAISNVWVRTGLTLLSATNVQHLFLHGCTFDSSLPNSFSTSAAAVRIEKCHAEIAACRIDGPGALTRQNSGGGPGLELIDSHVRATGYQTSIRGGTGTFLFPYLPGGPAAQLSNSQLVWSGLVFGRSLSAKVVPLIVLKNNSTVTKRTQAAPVLAMPASFARNQITRTTIHASPAALSLTYLSLEFTPFRTPLGTFVVDPSKSIPIGVFKHDGKGLRAFDLDLRGLPASFVSSPFVLQTFAVDTKSNLTVSAPRMGVVGH